MKKTFLFLPLICFIFIGSYPGAFAQTTFPYTGSVQTWTVPPGVHALFVDAQGAKGGAAGPIGPMIGVSTPGCGGRVQANLLVTPGQVLNINVGGSGSDGYGFSTTPGGYNGGGSTQPWTPAAPSYNGGSGGGKTDITVGTTKLIFAGGGGGAGYNGACTPGDQPGGGGGGLTGGNATTCDATLTGLGFTTIIHSAGGKQVLGGVGGFICCGGYYAGSNGASGIAGNNVDSGGIGGGGGGGYFGGGGGCWMGGGGGSSYTNPLFVAGVTHTQGYNCSDGTVTICILPDPGTMTGSSSLCVGATVVFSDTASGGTWSSDSISVATVSSSGSVTAVAAGTTTISYTVSNSCGTIAAIKAVTVNPAPDIGPIKGIDSVCPGHTDTLSDSVAGGVWSSFSAAIATVVPASGIVTGVASGTDTIYYTVTVAGCSSVEKFPIKVRTHASCNVGVNALEKSSKGLRVYPDPNPGIFTVSLLSDIDEHTLFVITNVLGEKIKEFAASANRPVSVQLNVPGGIYFINAATAHGRWTEKILVVR